MFHTVFLPEPHHIPVSSSVLGSSGRRRSRRGGRAPSSQDRGLLGDDFTAADDVLGSALGWARLAGALDETPPLAAYIERVSARAEFQNAHAG